LSKKHGCLLLAVDGWLLVVGCCWLAVVGCWLVGCWLLVVVVPPCFSVIETDGSQTLVCFFQLEGPQLVDLLVLRIGIIKAYLKDLEKLKRHGTYYYYTPGN